MDWKPVSAGDYFISAGTVHAIGAGITLVEVQQFAGITY
jgi:mannose-6-phosphate isomerase